MKPAGLALALIAALALGGVGPAGGAVQAGGPSYTGWDGVNPFRCALQNAGTGTAVPDPGADPYCVQFDKTHQNVTELGIVQFLLLEPARVAAASPKCFYFQSDHWRGSIVQDSGATEVYEFYGHYFFDKARGAGGVWVTDLNINGRTYDPNQIPGLPAQFAQYMGPGTGGVQATGDVKADPACAARASSDPGSVYAAPAAPRPAETGPIRVPPTASCLTPSGTIGSRGIGAVRLGDSADRVRALLGAPVHVRRGLMHYCLRGGGKFVVAQSPGGAVVILTTSAGYALGALRRGAPAAALRRTFAGGRQLLRQGETRVWASGRRANLIAGLRHGRVRFLAVYDRRHIRGPGALAQLLRRSQ